jgi:betaine lipid synthase
LKLAGISSLEFKDFWEMFGDGNHPQFETLLHDIISPHLSSQALQYWSHNSDRFSHKFYKTGYSGLAVTLVEWWIKMQGLQQDVHNMCHAETIEEQKRIWVEKIRPAIFSPMIRKVLNNPMFMWNALGGKCIELLHSHMRYCLSY